MITLARKAKHIDPVKQMTGVLLILSEVEELTQEKLLLKSVDLPNEDGVLTSG